MGLGRLSLDEILPAFGETKRARLAAVMSGSPDKAKLVARQYGLPEDAVYGYDAWDRLKANPDVQAVYIVTPNGVHRDNVVAAAAAGKQILCEKPMAVNSDECREMIAACAKAGVKLMIAYRCQYEPHNRAVIKLARSGEVRPAPADPGVQRPDHGTAGAVAPAEGAGGRRIPAGYRALLPEHRPRGPRRGAEPDPGPDPLAAGRSQVPARSRRRRASPSTSRPA